MTIELKKIMLARYYGFCMGVKRAIKIAEETGGEGIEPVNVINEIVHNDAVVSRLKKEGVGSVPSVKDIATGTVIVSAHGAPPKLFDEAANRGLRVVDATCPLVIRIHRIIHKLVENEFQIIHFGDEHHDETTGVMGQAPPDRVTLVGNVKELQALKRNGNKYALTSQTTAGVEEFDEVCLEAQKLFPGIEIFNTICNATTQRQSAVFDLAPEVELMLVVGSPSSANSTRLCSISEAICGGSYLINNADELDENWLDGVKSVGITAGASTPDFLVEQIIERLMDLSNQQAEVIRPPKKNWKEALKHDEEIENA